VKLLPMRHTPQSCQWSVPTLLMPRPYWLSASDAPWSCWNDRQIVVLSSTDICLTCPMWKPHEEDNGRIQTFPRQGAMPFREP
jgi:hypothetical protein